MSTKFMGVKFAPLSIPLERRLQTLAVLYYAVSFVFFGFGFLFLSLYILFFTKYYFISILYYIWFWFDHKQPHRGGRRFKLMRNAKVWEYMRDYFPVKTVKTAELDPTKNYVCGYHPHGIVCVGAFTSFNTEATGFKQIFPNIKPFLLTLTGQFWFPFHRDLILSTGSCAVSKESVTWLLTNEGKGNMIVIVIGGAAEALDAHPGFVKLTLRRRKGFVRLAIQHGASLLPIFAFGENELFSQVPNSQGSILRTIQNTMTKFMGFSPPIIFARGVFQYSFGYLPYRNPVNVVVGKPIDVIQNPNPSKEEVNRYHNLYIESLQQLFDQHKTNYEQYKNSTLELVG